MREQDQTNNKAWNPLTFGGLAAFAHAKLPRLLLVEFLFSLLIFGSVVWFVSRNYAPVIVRAVRQLPEGANLSNGEITGIDSRIAAENEFLSLVIDMEDLSDTGTGDVQFAFGQTNCWVCSDVSSSWGCLMFENPRATLDLSRSSVQPWWGARQPFLIGAVGATFIIGTFIVLPLLAFFLLWVARFVAYFADRKLTFTQAWRLAIAAQIPGIIVLCAGILLYGARAMDVLGVAVFYLLHVAVDLIYLIGAVFFLPPVVDPIKTNPFTASRRKGAGNQEGN